MGKLREMVRNIHLLNHTELKFLEEAIYTERNKKQVANLSESVTVWKCAGRYFVGTCLFPITLSFLVEIHKYWQEGLLVTFVDRAHDAEVYSTEDNLYITHHLPGGHKQLYIIPFCTKNLGNFFELVDLIKKDSGVQ